MTDEFEILRQLASGACVDDTPENQLQADQFGLEFIQRAEGIALAAPLELLDPARLFKALSPVAHQRLSRLDLHWTIDSTNSYVMNLGRSDDFHGYVCVAEQQTSGRGRRGRNWVSPFGKNIYLTLGWVMPHHRSIDGLSLAVGTAVVAAIRSVSEVSVQLKWPNDILINGGKAAGILIEIAAGPGADRRLAIGIGINLQLSGKDAGTIDQPWSVIEGVSRNALAAALISQLVVVLEEFAELGFEPFRERWQSCDAHYGQEVRLIASEKVTVGVSRGVDASGHLVLETSEGEIAFNAGEVSLRSMQ